MAPAGKKRKQTVAKRKKNDRERKRRVRASLTLDQLQTRREKDILYNRERRKKFSELSDREQRKIREQKRERVRRCRANKKKNALGDNFIPSSEPRSNSVVHTEGRLVLNISVANNCILENQLDPPSHQAEEEEVRQTLPTNQSGDIRKTIEKVEKRKRLKLEKEVAELRETVKALTKKNKKLQKRLERKNQKSTPDKIFESIANNLDKPTVRKRLVYNEVVMQQLEARKGELGANIVTPPKLKAYKLVLEHTKLLSYRQIKGSFTKRAVAKAKKNPGWFAKVKEFLEDDENSRLCSGKRETVTRNKIKMQKRYLNDSLKNLHKAFVRKYGDKMSYSKFCKLRPFYIKDPNVRERETCACKIHSNFSLKVKKLADLKVLSSPNIYDIFDQSVCDRSNPNCIQGKCQDCPQKLLLTMDDDIKTAVVTYEKWVQNNAVVLIKGKEKTIRTVSKEIVSSTVADLCSEFILELEEFKRHAYAIRHQYRAIKALKENLKKEEVIVHIDFSENYSTKCNEEIQTVHFGASRKQLSLHTGLFYYVRDGRVTSKSFGTLSTNLDHGAHAIQAHMAPIFRLIKKNVESDVEVIHFLSDGPTTQYRNQYNLNAMAEKLGNVFPHLKGFVWNYTIASHGKGPADGVGAALKRKADKFVAYGNDLTEVHKIVSYLQENTKVFVAFIPSQDFDEAKRDIEDMKKNGIMTKINGIMTKHQVIWFKGFVARELSNYPINRDEFIQKDSKLKLNYAEVHSSDEEVEIVPGDYVVATYLQKEYPGVVLEVRSTGYVVKCMEKMLQTKKWRWPSKPDVLVYNKAHVRKIQPPEGCRGYFNVPELDNFK